MTELCCLLVRVSDGSAAIGTRSPGRGARVPGRNLVVHPYHLQQEMFPAGVPAYVCCHTTYMPGHTNSKRLPCFAAASGAPVLCACSCRCCCSRGVPGPHTADPGGRCAWCAAAGAHTAVRYCYCCMLHETPEQTQPEHAQCSEPNNCLLSAQLVQQRWASLHTVFFAHGVSVRSSVHVAAHSADVAAARMCAAPARPPALQHSHVIVHCVMSCAVWPRVFVNRSHLFACTPSS